MKECYLLSNDKISINKLAKYYMGIGDTENGIKYYLQDIDDYAMVKLADYYESVKDYKKWKSTI